MEKIKRKEGKAEGKRGKRGRWKRKREDEGQR